MRNKVLLTVILTAAIAAVLFSKRNDWSQMSNNSSDEATIQYVAIGDSYTIGEGVAEQDRWPNVLTKHLQESGIAIELVANPSRTGWTTKDALVEELPVFEAADADFVTVLLGVNDWVQGVSPDQFRTNFAKILDELSDRLPNQKNIVVITIPDFSATRTGPMYANGRDISAGTAEFNKIITQEAQKRGLPVVDIYPLSQSFKGNDSMVVTDGLHPSAEAYLEWEKLIYPEAEKVLHSER